MLFLLALLVGALVVWVLTVRDILVRRKDLGAGQRVTWIIVTLVLPFFAIPIYWLIKPRPRKPTEKRAGH